MKIVQKILYKIKKTIQQILYIIKKTIQNILYILKKTIKNFCTSCYLIIDTAAFFYSVPPLL